MKRKISKKATPKKRIAKKRIAKTVRTELKAKGVRLPHGYEVKPRTITGVFNEGKKMIVKQIGDLESKKFIAKTKRERTGIQKQISSLKRSYNKLT